MSDEVEKEHERKTLAGLIGAGLRSPVEETEGECSFCNRKVVTIAKRRLNTAYAKEESNWLTSCADCYERAVEGYNELWDEYYSGII